MCEFVRMVVVNCTKQNTSFWMCWFARCCFFFISFLHKTWRSIKQMPKGLVVFFFSHSTIRTFSMLELFGSISTCVRTAMDKIEKSSTGYIKCVVRVRSVATHSYSANLHHLLTNSEWIRNWKKNDFFKWCFFPFFVSSAFFGRLQMKPKCLLFFSSI